MLKGVLILNKLRSLSGNKIFRYSIGYATVDGIQKLSYFLAIPIFTKLMTSSEYGEVMVCLSVVAIQQVIFSLSTRGAIARFYVKANIENQLSLLLSTTLILTLLMAGFWALVSLIAFSIQIDIFRLVGITRPSLIGWSIIVALTNSFIQIFFTIQKTGRKFSSYSIFTIIYIVTQIGGIYAGIKSDGSGAEGYMKGLATSNLIWALIFVSLLFVQNRLKIKPAMVKIVLGYSLTVFPVDLISLATAYTDRYVTSAYLGATEVAMYSLANQFAAMVGMACLAFNNAYVPQFFRACDNGQGEMEEIYQAAKIFVAVISALGLLGLLVASLYVSAFLSQSYHFTLYLLPIYFSTISLNAVYLIGTNALALTKQLLIKKFAVLFFALLFNLALSVLLVKIVGFSGPAYSGLITQILICVAYSEIVRRSTTLKFPFYSFMAGTLAAGMLGAFVQKSFF